MAEHTTHINNNDSDVNARRVLWAMILTGGFMVVEIAGGVISGSLALLADAGHMFTDVGALILAWFAFYITRKPPDSKRSYGYHRFQVLAAFINGITLVVLVGWIIFEAIHRFTGPVEIMGRMMLIVAIVGLIVNIVSFKLLHGGDRKNLNMQGAAIHVLGDMLGSVATIVAAVVILWTGWTPIDPLLSIFVALLILKSAWSLVRKSAHLLLEGAPEWLNVDQLRSELKETIPAIEDIHHVHAWSLSPEQTILTLHACVSCDADYKQTLADIKKILIDKFGITHSTVQIEQASCSDQAHT
ncbi:Cobalt-zinc-cadmium resistance protein CzcD [hydrothermal vent metagenome]|uniref:Cobalt-zinc-cadmium resistance protein CzcD n=1 Tax=hydrothermal vent metagenome TaxID=652676 RepID=A0A3B1B9S4_9ZZZZ